MRKPLGAGTDVLPRLILAVVFVVAGSLKLWGGLEESGPPAGLPEWAYFLHSRAFLYALAVVEIITGVCMIASRSLVVMWSATALLSAFFLYVMYLEKVGVRSSECG